MKITSIYIKNYKSIKEMKVILSDKVNVFIGENSVGKSNIFSAIDWMLGPVYPSFNNFSKEDYYGGDMSANVVVRLQFDDHHYLELNNCWHDQYGRAKSGLNLDGNQYVSDDIRQKYVSALIGADRKVADNPATNRWTLLGRLLRDINRLLLSQTITRQWYSYNYLGFDLQKWQRNMKNTAVSLKSSRSYDILYI